MAPVRRVATAMATIGVRAALSAAAIMVAACGAPQSAGSGTASPTPAAPASHANAAVTGSMPWPASSQPGRDNNGHDRSPLPGGICHPHGTYIVCEWADPVNESQFVQAPPPKPTARRP